MCDHQIDQIPAHKQSKAILNVCHLINYASKSNTIFIFGFYFVLLFFGLVFIFTDMLCGLTVIIGRMKMGRLGGVAMGRLDVEE